MKIHIAIPTKDEHVHAGVLVSICSLIASTDHEYTLDFLAGSIISQVRNRLVRNFLNTDADRLLFWDSDIVPELLFISRILGDSDICAAPCRVKGSIDLNIGKVKDDRVHRQTSLNGSFDVVGTGLMMVKRSVFETIPAPWFEVIDHANGEALGEDFNFCLKARDLGLSISVASISTVHYGVAGWQYKAQMTTTA